jgi:predicted nucleotidyltransferase
LHSHKNVPDSIRDSLRRYYLKTAKSNILHDCEMLRIIQLLKEVHIAAIPLKGVIASEVVFGNAGLYPSSDIDILVKPADLEEVKKVLAANGYAYQEKNERNLLTAHYHLIFSNEKHHVEVHWNLVKRYIKITPDFWWKDVSDVEYQGMKIVMLSPERYILYAISRLFDHGSGRINSFF